MKKFKNQIEGQIQEIVFFSSLTIAFTVFVSGLAYLILGRESLQLVIGSLGTSINQGFFSAFGYGFFYFAFFALHLGAITNFHVFNFYDLKREIPLLSYSTLAHLILLTLFSNILSVLQFSFDISPTSTLPYGPGGFIGAFIANGLYSVAGVYGSLLLLLGLMIITGLVAEFFELKDLHTLVKKSSLSIKQQSVRALKVIQSQILQFVHFFLKGQDMNDLALQSASAVQWISNSVHRANHLLTEQFHIYQRKEVPQKAPAKIETKKTSVPPIEVKKAPSKKTVVKKTAAEKLLGKKSKLSVKRKSPQKKKTVSF